MKKRVFLLLFLIIFLSKFVSSGNTYPRTFSTDDGSTGQVTAIWYTCINSDCTQIKANPTSNLFSPNPKTFSSISTLNIVTPDSPESYYLVRYFMEGYLSMKLGIRNIKTRNC